MTQQLGGTDNIIH